MRLFSFLLIMSIISSCYTEENNALELPYNKIHVPLVSEIDSNLSNSINEAITEEPYVFAYLSTLPKDTLKITLDGYDLCLNHNLDSLASVGSTNGVFLIDLTNDLALFNWAPFLGAMYSTKLAENKYSFNGAAKFPVNGDWGISFVNKEILRYVLEIHDDHYIFYRDKSIRLELPYDIDRIAELESEIMNRENCSSKDWNIATECFDEIKMYEYHLFAAILGGHLNYTEQYFNLRNSISIINAGEVSEYLEGNYYLLRLYGIADDEDYDFGMLKLLYGSHASKACY